MTTSDLNRGYIWHKGIYHSSIPEDLFPADCTPELFKAILQDIDGSFSIVLERSEYLLAAVDRIRSQPLFYALHQGELLLDTNAFALRSRLLETTLDYAAVPEFLITAYTSGNDTLYKEVKQLQAGQFLAWHAASQTLQVRDYHHYQHIYEPINEPLVAMDTMHEHIFQRLIDSAEGRTLVVPLSGGYDSRLIAAMLKRLGYPKVICFTYGNPRHGECVTSRKVAKFLNLPWIMVEHNRRQWFDAFQSADMQRFWRYSTNLSASPHVQDWLAVQQLKQRKLIPEDSIIVPGHSGGSLQGANLVQIFEDKDDLTAQDLLNAIFQRYFTLWPCSLELRNRLFSQRVTQRLQIPETLKAETAASLYDEWDRRDRQAKFIANSVRVYEFFGYDWRLPLWDAEFLNFWSRIPVEQRMHRSLFKQYVQKYQTIPLPTYFDYSWPQRIVNRVIRARHGFLINPAYGRYLDYRDRAAYLTTPVSTLCEEDFDYPAFVRQDFPILHTQVNAVQALIYLQALLQDKL